MLSVRIVILLFLLLCQPKAAQSTPAEPTEEDLVIVELLFEKQQLSDSLFAYSVDDSLFLPLEELAGLLNFSLTVNAQNRTASGWFIQPERTFDLNLNRNTVVISSIKQRLPEHNNILKRNGDLYVPVTLLEQWFPIHLELNFSDMRLTLTSDEPLPLQQQLQRQKKRRHTTSNNQNTSLVRYHEDSYHWASYPTLDLTINTAFSDQTNSLTTALSASGDLLKHAAYLNYNYSNQTDSQNIRLNLSRYAATPDQQLAGGLFSYQLGDIYTLGDSLISSGGDGVGLALTSARAQRRGRYSDTVIEGDAPAGWEAELYHNGNLLAFQTTNNEGIYRFADVALWYGDNNFEVRLFGPQGQALTQRHSNYIGNSLLKSGRFSYSLYAINEENSRLFGTQPSAGPQPSAHDLRAELNYGLNDTWSIGTALSQLEYKEGNLWVPHTYLSINNDISLRNAFIQTIISHDSKGGNAALLALRSVLAGQSISLQYRRFNNFSSEKNPLNNRLSHDTHLRLNGRLSTSHFIGYSLAIKQEAFARVADRYEVNSRLSTQLAGINLTQNQALTKQSGTAAARLPGSLSLSRYNTWGGISAALTYNLHDDNGLLQSISSTLHNNLNHRKHNLLRLSYSPNSSPRWSIQNDLTWKFDQANLTLHAGTDGQNRWRAGAAINFSTGFDSMIKRPWFSANASSKSGKVNTRVFLDRDNTGTFSPGDQPLSGVSLTGTRVDSHQQSNRAGHLQLRNLPSLQPIVVGIDDSTLEDPFWQLREQPDSLYLHAGAQADLALPVIAISEIEGRMFSGDDDGQYPIKSTQMRLINEKGDVIATTWSEFDGLFLFDNVRPGNYQVQADYELLNKKSLSRPTAQPVTATADGGVINIGTTVLYSRSTVHGTPPDSSTFASLSTIKGQIYARDNNSQDPVAAVRMQLLDAKGIVIAATQSDAEGSFVFTGVTPGNYQVKTDHSSLLKTGLSRPSPHAISAPKHGTDIDLGSTVLYRRPKISINHKG